MCRDRDENGNKYDKGRPGMNRNPAGSNANAGAIPHAYFYKMVLIMVIVRMTVVLSRKDHSAGSCFVIAPGVGDCVFAFMGTTAIVLPLS